MKLNIQLFGGRGASSSNELDKIKTQKGKIEYLNEKYKDILSGKITYFRVKKWYTGDKKTGKYDWQYNADIKPYGENKLRESIMVGSIEELARRIEMSNKRIKLANRKRR